MSRSDSYFVKVVIDGTDTGLWDQMEGGGMTSESVRHRPGGQEFEVSLGGPPSQEEITLMRLEDRDRDDFALSTFLMSRVGRADVKIVRTPKALTGDVSGPARTHRGRLTGVSPPNYDSNGGDPALWSITVDPVGAPT